MKAGGGIIRNHHEEPHIASGRAVKKNLMAKRKIKIEGAMRS
jgi:hypothetical protein